MQAWILDESPGAYRWGSIDLPELAADDVAIRVVASALNHMDLWVTRGAPKPPLPHVPGCDVAGVVSAIGSAVTTVAVGDEVVVNPGVSPVGRHRAWGNDSPMGPGFMIYGEHCWGGHAETAIAPERNVRKRPATRTWEECAAFPLAYLTAYRMLRRARLRSGDTLLVVGIGSGVSCAALALGTMMGARVEVTSRSEEKRAQALEMGAAAVRTTAPRRSGPSRPTSWSRASARRRGTNRCARSSPAAGWSCAAAPRAEGRADPAAACSSSSSRSSARRWAATRSSTRCWRSSTRVCRSPSTRSISAAGLPRCTRSPRARRAARQDRPDPRRELTWMSKR